MDKAKAIPKIKKVDNESNENSVVLNTASDKLDNLSIPLSPLLIAIVPRR